MLKTSEHLDKIAPALVAFQAQLRPIPKLETNPHLKNKYASLDNILGEIRERLAEHGLAVVQGPTSPEEGRGQIGMTTRIIHTSGQWIESEIAIPIGEVGKGRNLAQEVGSTITYLRRYCLGAALAITTDDDDDGQPARKPDPPGATRAPAQKKAPTSGNGRKAPAQKKAPPSQSTGKAPADGYWDSLGPTEKACYREWENVRGHLKGLARYEDNIHAVDGAINKLFPGFQTNGYPLAKTADEGQARVMVYRTVKAYAELRDQDADPDRAQFEAFQLAKNLAPS